jgi:hypothetical protein
VHSQTKDEERFAQKATSDPTRLENINEKIHFLKPIDLELRLQEKDKEIPTILFNARPFPIKQAKTMMRLQGITCDDYRVPWPSYE